MASQNIPRSNSKQKHSLFALLPLQLLWLAFFCLLFVASTQPAALFQKRSNLFQVISFWVSAHGITNIQIDRQVQWFGWHHLHYGLKLPLVFIFAYFSNDFTVFWTIFMSWKSWPIKRIMTFPNFEISKNGTTSFFKNLFHSQFRCFQMNEKFKILFLQELRDIF